MSEAQEEECIVLQSIYDGDSAFTQVNNTVFQYQYGDEGSYKSFNVEVRWSGDYPECPAVISMDTFYNSHVCRPLREALVKELTVLAEENVGSPATFTLFEHIRDHLERFLEIQPISASAALAAKNQAGESADAAEGASKKPKKEQMTKAQKRKHFDRVGQNGEMPRGYNWANVIRHLQQTGVQKSGAGTS